MDQSSKTPRFYGKNTSFYESLWVLNMVKTTFYGSLWIIAGGYLWFSQRKKDARTTGPLDPWRTRRPWHSPAPAAVGTSEKMATRFYPVFLGATETYHLKGNLQMRTRTGSEVILGGAVRVITCWGIQFVYTYMEKYTDGTCVSYYLRGKSRRSGLARPPHI